MKQLFTLIASTIIKNTNKKEIIRLNNDFVDVDPRSWDASADMIVNVGIGTGQEKEKQAMLGQMLSVQMDVWQKYGPTNGLVTMTNVRNTLSDLLALSGIKNSEKYFQPVTEQSEAQLIQLKQQQAAQRAQQQGAMQTDPNQAFMATEQMKAQTKAQVDMAKLQLDAQKAANDNKFKMHELAMKDDLQRDEMVQDLAVKVAEILGKYGAAVDTAAVKAEQDKERPHNKEMMNGLQEASY